MSLPRQYQGQLKEAAKRPLGVHHQYHFSQRSGIRHLYLFNHKTTRQ